jgi:hypothetical protein
MEILVAAEMLQVDSLKRQACITFLKESLDKHTACNTIKASRELGLSALEDGCLNYIRAHMADVFCSPHISELPEEVLMQLLREDDTYVPEEAIFEGVVAWGGGE